MPHLFPYETTLDCGVLGHRKITLFYEVTVIDTDWRVDFHNAFLDDNNLLKYVSEDTLNDLAIEIVTRDLPEAASE